MVEYYIDNLKLQHDARVTELLKANNAEVERRRSAFQDGVNSVKVSMMETLQSYYNEVDNELELLMTSSGSNENYIQALESLIYKVERLLK